MHHNITLIVLKFNINQIHTSSTSHTSSQVHDTSSHGETTMKPMHIQLTLKTKAPSLFPFRPTLGIKEDWALASRSLHLPGLDYTAHELNRGTGAAQRMRQNVRHVT